MSCPTKQRRQYMIADMLTALGAFMLPQTSHPVPAKSKTASPFVVSMYTLSLIGDPSSIASSAISTLCPVFFKCFFTNDFQHVSYSHLSIRLYMPHIRLYNL